MSIANTGGAAGGLRSWGLGDWGVVAWGDGRLGDWGPGRLENSNNQSEIE